MRVIDVQYLNTPCYGSRQTARHLRRQGKTVNRKRVRQLMRLMGLSGIESQPKTSTPSPAHPIYPYLLRDVPLPASTKFGGWMPKTRSPWACLL